MCNGGFFVFLGRLNGSDIRVNDDGRMSAPVGAVESIPRDVLLARQRDITWQTIRIARGVDSFQHVWQA